MPRYKPNDENRQKAKKQLKKSGFITIHIRDQDPMRPTTIGLDVLERDPSAFVTYPPSPTLLPTNCSSYEDVGSHKENIDNDND
ncbi:hypothetical protein MFLAVUS_006829 [Mucor flavus]|uniref:Uncharacterized protein n=1 Tax=Mucor flavus TaxID=439312 RepID=A0ABP9Z2L8_9FUNG